MKFNSKALIAFFAFDIIVVIVILYFVISNIKTYEQGEEINDNGNLITVNKTKKMDFKKDTTDGGNFLIDLKYVVPDGPLKGAETELFRLENSKGDQSPVEKVWQKWDDHLWTNLNMIKNYNGELFLVRVEAPDSDSKVYRVRLKVE